MLPAEHQNKNQRQKKGFTERNVKHHIEEGIMLEKQSKDMTLNDLELKYRNRNDEQTSREESHHQEQRLKVKTVNTDEITIF